MKKNQIRVAIAIVIGISFVVPAIALAQTNQDRAMIRLLDRLARRSLKGYTPPNNTSSRMGYLDEGNQIEIPVKLSKGKNYGFAAVCDPNCSDVDLILKDANDRVIQEDIEDRDTAVVKHTAKKTGRYYLSIDMAACDDLECAYGVGLYRK